uniref:Elongin A, like n=1 Tax=Sander lucioperca TaxID=283035 RepID=A0A8C9ZUE8_SANLU
HPFIETGIGKTVNSLRRHEQAGELAKSLVRDWKRLVPKESTSLTMDDSNNNGLASHGKRDSTDEALFKTGSRKADSEKQCEEQKKHKYQNEKQEKKKHGTVKYKQESEKNKKAKIKHKDKRDGAQRSPEEPSLSFESYLNYDVNVFKRKERSGAKKPPKTIKTVKEEVTKYPGMKPFTSPVMSINVTSPTQKFKESVLELIPFTIPLPAVLPEYCLFFDKESDFCDVSEESAGFTGQRLNKKMQVYSGAKTVFLPTMMSLHQQCIRTLQNNINLLYETGGVPFEILEPVLERCTPEQLLRIEEYNPIYIGETDHLWGKHCQRDFKDSKLQEYESWKEMYVRLSEERERKLKRLTKSIVSAHSSKPKGRQVKMAFIHTVAKPPRDVRIQQEIHGTAVQQPPLRFAPMMAKSLKAFKKQLGRR